MRDIKCHQVRRCGESHGRVYSLVLVEIQAVDTRVGMKITFLRREDVLGVSFSYLTVTGQSIDILSKVHWRTMLTSISPEVVSVMDPRLTL